MKLIALLLGLALEKMFTNIFDLNELRWLDRYFDRGLAWMGNDQGVRAHAVGFLWVILPVAPVIALAYWLGHTWGGVIYLAISVAILFVSLGPRDLSAEVDEFASAAASGDEEATCRVAKELLEFDPPEEQSARGKAVASAVFVQSNNRTFGVVLWFVLLGPIGAWMFRVADLMRRRAFYESDRKVQAGEKEAAFLTPVQNIHGVLAWLPSRLAAMSFALAGSFEPATTAWKDYYTESSEHFFEVNDDVVASAGCGAMGRQAQEEMEKSAVAGAVGSLDLVNRSVIVWLVVISLLTIAGAAI